jgi:hypothetical protein
MNYRLLIVIWLVLVLLTTTDGVAQIPLQPVVPKDQRGRNDWERSGFHDAGNIRTVFYNFGMVGDYPADPLNVDLSVFHSVEIPKGSGLNYADGITPFVLAKIKQQSGDSAYIMETGYRERQVQSPYSGKIMRFEPRPGYLQSDPTINRGRSIALSNDPRTWPDSWPDKLNDLNDPGWQGSWNGYFGKRPNADQESFFVIDDDYYDSWNFYPDSRDVTRRGLGLRMEVRGFQWANPQATNVIFWHYDITNESTTDYVDNIIFGLYMDSGVGGESYSCDGVAESDDDNAYFDRSLGVNLVYTWDKYGHGVSLSSNCAPTGYLGYAYMETPGNPFNGIDDDQDGITDERRDSGPGQLITGQDSIRAYVTAHYNMSNFETFYGKLENRPAFKAGRWWTGDEDMDWVADYDDVGADGVPGTHDLGEGDGKPTAGEPDFDQTDPDESDQIGLTGFKMNRIKGPTKADTVDDIVFYGLWPPRLYQMWTNPILANRFDNNAVVLNYNIAFLFASGTFRLVAGEHERFSLALAYGANLGELKTQVHTVQQIYNASYQFAVPPPLPTVTADAGDKFVRVSWSDYSERGINPVTHINDFEGYRIYRSTDPEFRDPKVITNANGTGPFGNGKPIAQFDLKDGIQGFSKQIVEGVAYELGSETGLTHTFLDTTVTNGQDYYYAVCAYNYGSDSLDFFPSENSIAVSRTPRGGTILPANVIEVRPDPKVPGYVSAGTSTVQHSSGTGTAAVNLRIVDPKLVPDKQTFLLRFYAHPPSAIHATRYELFDSTTQKSIFDQGTDFVGAGLGPVGVGILPIISTPAVTSVDTARSGFLPGSATNARLKIVYLNVDSADARRLGYPNDFIITFSNTYLDTSLIAIGRPSVPVKFKVTADTGGGIMQYKVYFNDANGDGSLSAPGEFIDIITFHYGDPTPRETWRVTLDTTGQYLRGALVAPTLGDIYDAKLSVPVSFGDVYSFTTTRQSISQSVARMQANNKPYVVPNPYAGAASFEPERFATTGRGDRRMEFRNIPLNGTIRIYTVRGDLVQTLHQDGSVAGYVAWNLRTKDNLDVAPGLYIYAVEAPGMDSFIGKFAIIK